MDAEDHTPLLKAVVYGQPRAVQSLVLAGVDLDKQDSSGSTAVHVSIENIPVNVKEPFHIYITRWLLTMGIVWF